MNITFSKKAVKALKSLDTATDDRILKGIMGIPQGDIQPLIGYSDGRKRLRIGKYRIIFLCTDNQDLYVIDIGSRGDIYK